MKKLFAVTFGYGNKKDIEYFKAEDFTTIAYYLETICVRINIIQIKQLKRIYRKTDNVKEVL